MPELYNEYEAMSDAGYQLDRELTDALCPIIVRWAHAGYALRDISSMGHDIVSVIVNEEILRRAMAKVKEERIAREAKP